jgi:hypothetical protein
MGFQLQSLGTGMDTPARNAALTAPLKISGTGLEIAPYFNPVVIKCVGRKLYYTDYIGTEEIRAKAAANPGAPGRDVPAIDFVWTPGADLRKCAPQHLTFDYAIASHVFEHVPNPIGWINQIMSVLHVGATLGLVVPDRRLTSDFYRRETSLAEVIALAISAPSIPTPLQILDFMLYGIEDFGEIKYDQNIPFSARKRTYPHEEAVQVARIAQEHRQYFDVHCTVWTAQSFAEIMTEVSRLGLLPAAVAPPIENGGEFIVHITKTGSANSPQPSLRKSSWRRQLSQVLGTTNTARIRRLRRIIGPLKPGGRR